MSPRAMTTPEHETGYPTCCGGRSSRCAGQAHSCAPLWAQQHSSGARRSRARLASVSPASRRSDNLFGALALAELGPSRVASPFDLWLDLRERQLISEKVFEQLLLKTTKTSGLPDRPLRFS
jgi:hypothetical protein